MGELQGGWLTANAVLGIFFNKDVITYSYYPYSLALLLGYNLPELVSGRNVFTDFYSM